ncbi:hypothetical protein NMG60_11036415 [Bertholletia excelsa]
MGKRWGWISAVRKVFYLEPKEKKEKKTNKSKSKSLEKEKNDEIPSLDKEKSDDPSSSPIEISSPGKEKNDNPSSSHLEIAPPSLPTPTEKTKLRKIENEQDKHTYSIALATTVAAIAATQAAAEVVRLTLAARSLDKPNKDAAAIKIQAAFRGYLARKSLRSLRGWARLKSLIQGQSVKRQTIVTLQCMQNLARVQSQIHTRRMRMSEDNQALQRQLSQHKHEKEIKKLRPSMESDWNNSPQSKEQLKAKLQSKQEAAMRREKALAYASSHKPKGKASSEATTTATMMNLNNPHWGWSWLERWTESRPWETCDKELINDSASVKCTPSVLRKSQSSSDLKLNIKLPPATTQKSSRLLRRQSLSMPISKILSVATRTRPSSPNKHASDDSRSVLSFQPERYKCNSKGRSVARGDENIVNSPSVPNHLPPISSGKAKTRPPSPLRIRTSEKRSVTKQLSLPSSPTETKNNSH